MAGEEDFLLDLRFRQCTFFLVRKKKTAGGKQPGEYCGTCFGIAMGLNGEEDPRSDANLGEISYIVTAAHVINGTRDGEELHVRVNTAEGKTHDIIAPVSRWKFHTVTDVAVCAIDWPDDVALEVMLIPLKNLPKSMNDVAEKIVEGEETIAVGLLPEIPGSERIQPIIRTGNIALMPHEKFNVEVGTGRGAGKRIENVKAYLLEMIAWPGFSGSPVIVYPNRNPRNPRVFDYMAQFLVLGLVHGLLLSEREVKFSRETMTIKLGAGISVAIPGEDIYEVIVNNGDLRIQRAELLEQARAKAGKTAAATPSSVKQDVNVSTEQDFEADLRKATRRVEPSEPDSEKR
jgi:hypothetical protein